MSGEAFLLDDALEDEDSSRKRKASALEDSDEDGDTGAPRAVRRELAGGDDDRRGARVASPDRDAPGDTDLSGAVRERGHEAVRDEVDEQARAAEEDDNAEELEDEADFEDEEDEGDEDDDDEEDGTGASVGPDGDGKKKKKKLQRNRFIDDIADVDDDEDEDEGDEGDEEGAGEFIEDDAEGHRAVDTARLLRERNLHETQMSREQEQEIIERYQRLDRMTNVQASREDEEVLDQHSLLPSPNDPKLWMVKCVAGFEKEIVAQIMTRYLFTAAKGRPLQIFSAVCHDTPPGHLGTKREGHVYVEARTAQAVSEAIGGLRNVLQSKQIMKVPLAEMTDTLTVKEAAARVDLRPGAWVRVTSRGIYQGDLGQVEHADQTGAIFVRLVPRIDYVALIKRAEDRKAGIRPAPFGGVRNGGARARAAPFNVEEATHAGQTVEKRNGVDNAYLMNGKEYRDGYEVKRLTVKGLQAVKDPPLAEVQFFLQASSAATGTDEAKLMAVASTQQATFAVGDLVVVTKGDLTNLQGKVVEIDAANDKVFVMPEDLDGFNEKLDFAPSELRKHIATGARVKIVSGSHHVGDLGVVTYSSNGVAEVLLDSTQTTAKVLINNLSETNDIDSGLQSIGSYVINQLVQLTDGTVGMIIRISADAAHILTASAAPDAPLRLARVHEIRKVMERSKRLPAPDSQRQRVTANALVEVLDGAFKGKVGSVIHVNQPHLWVQCQSVTRNNGHFVVMSTLTRLKGGAKRQGDAAGIARLTLNPQSPAVGSMRPPASYGSGRGILNIASPQVHGGGFGAGRGGPGGLNGAENGGRFGGGRFGSPGRGRGRGFQDALVGQRVRVVKGAFRGYMGVVQQATESHCRIELDASTKIVTVKREIVSTDTLDSTRGHRRAGAGRMLPPRTPSHVLNPKTPVYTPATPARSLHTDSEYRPSGAVDLGTDEMPLPTPGNGYAPYTPGAGMYTPGMNQFTPGTVPYTPGTAGAGPMTPAATPGTAVRTPGTMALQTPGTGLGGAAYGATPYGALKMPGVATPGPGGDGGGSGAADDSVQHYVGIQVYQGEEKAVVQSVDAATGIASVSRGEEDGETGMVAVIAGTATVDIPLLDLELVQPTKDDRIRVLRRHSDAQPGEEGSYISLDDTDVFVKLERAGSMPVVSLPRSHIGKVNIAPPV